MEEKSQEGRQTPSTLPKYMVLCVCARPYKNTQKSKTVPITFKEPLMEDKNQVKQQSALTDRLYDAMQWEYRTESIKISGKGLCVFGGKGTRGENTLEKDTLYLFFISHVFLFMYFHK